MIKFPVLDCKNSRLKSIKTDIIAKRCSLLETQKADSVEISKEAKLLAFAETIYSRSQKFTIEDYNSLSRFEKTVLREMNTSVRKAALDSVNVGLKVKEHLDKRYGNDGYVFGCIGTSASGIARVLEFSGVETKYLPISHLSFYYEDDKFRQFEDKFPVYKQFLDEQGLSCEAVATSNKHFLFYDYIYSGRSLSVFRQIMDEYFGFNLPNVGIHSADYLCYSSCAKKIDPPQYALDYVDKYMKDQNISDVGGVPHLPLSQIDMIDECKKHESIQAKMFNFTVIDELSKKGLLKENPKNKNSL